MHGFPSMLPSKNSFMLVGSLCIARLEINDASAPDKLLFFRDEACELWLELDKFQSNPLGAGLIVEGSPGVGKSCVVWAWLSCQNAKHSVNGIFALWVNFSPGMPTRVVLFKKDVIYWVDMLESELETLLRSDIDLKFIVLDGLFSQQAQGNSQIHACAFLKRSRQKTCKIITVMSMAVKRYPEAERIMHISSFEVFPWSLQQCQEACADREFLQSVKNKLLSQIEFPNAEEVKELVQKKYHYAGGSARWMFSLSQEELLHTIKVHAAQILNVEALINGTLGENCLISSNHLLSRYKNGSTITVFMTSKFVASRLLSKCEASAYRVVYSLASQLANPAFLGWVVEFDFISQMRRCCVQERSFEFVSSVEITSGIQWSVPKLVDFDPDSAFKASEMPEGCWLKPVKWNQEAYDLMGLFCDSQSGNRYLRFVQITDAAEHTANFQIFQKIAAVAQDVLKCELGIEIIVVSPDTRAKFPTKILKKNASSLFSFNIGPTDLKWKSESMDTSIEFLYFKLQSNM